MQVGRTMAQKLALLAILIITLSWPITGGTGELTDKELRERVRSILEKLASPDCAIRQQAVLEEWARLPTTDLPGLIAILEEQLQSTAAPARFRGAVILESLKREHVSNGGEAFEVLLRLWLAPALGASSRDKPAQFKRAKLELLRIAKNRSNPLSLRAAAIAVISYLVDHYGDPYGKAERMGVPIKEWKRELILLLRGPDPELKTMAAITMGSLSGFADVSRSKLVPILIAGLRNEDFDIRLGAQQTLRKLTGEQFCIDPTDTIGEREVGIRKWKEWWAAAKPKPMPERP